MFTYDRELLVPQGCFEIGSSDNSSIAHPVGDGNPTAGRLRPSLKKLKS